MDQMYVKVFADCNIFLTPPLLAHSAFNKAQLSFRRDTFIVFLSHLDIEKTYLVRNSLNVINDGHWA